MGNTQLLHDVPDVMERTRLGQSTVRKLIRTGELKSVTIGRRRLVRADDLQAYINGLGR